MYVDRQTVEVWDGRRWRSTWIDAPGDGAPWAGDCGWICVVGWPGRMGPVSVRIESVRVPS